VQPRMTPAEALSGAPRNRAAARGVKGSPVMTDLLILALTVGLFAASAGLVTLFDRM